MEKNLTGQGMADPLNAAYFAIEFGSKVKFAYFREVSGLGSEHEVITTTESTEKGKTIQRQIPGKLKLTPVTLKKGLTDSLELWTWRQEVEAGKIDSARSDGFLVMYDQTNTPKARWKFLRAWPSKISGPTADAKSNDIGIEELTLVYEGYERVAV
jgi:phage tail-like protein